MHKTTYVLWLCIIVKNWKTQVCYLVFLGRRKEQAHTSWTCSPKRFRDHHMFTLKWHLTQMSELPVFSNIQGRWTYSVEILLSLHSISFVTKQLINIILDWWSNWLFTIMQHCHSRRFMGCKLESCFLDSLTM